MKYHAFISYSHADKRWAEWVHRKVETYRLPEGVRQGREDLPERFYPVFRDRDELAGASVLGDRLREALRESDWLVVVCSPRAAKSEWVNEEVRYFKSLGREARVLCFVVDGVPKASVEGGEAGQECFPKAILHPVPENGEPDESRREEPLAADARPEGDGKRAALLKIIAGMAEVRFGDLVRRDQQRAIRRLRWMVAGGSALVLAFASLGTALYFQKKEAVRQRDMAREVRDGAQELNTFIIVDLHSKLRDLGRLDLLEDVTAKVLEYHDRMPSELADDPEVLRARAVAMDYAGQQAMNRGNAAGAVLLLRKSRKAWLALIGRNDSGEEALAGNVVSTRILAEALGSTGDRKGALAACEEGLESLSEWAGDDSGKSRRIRIFSAMILSEKGDTLRRMGRRKEALSALGEAAMFAKEAVEHDPDNPKRWREAAECFSQLAVMYREEDDLSSALGQARSAVKTSERFAEFDLGNAVGWMLVESSGSVLFGVLASMGEWEEAEKVADDRLHWVERLRGRDPVNPTYMGAEARARDDHAMALGKQIKVEAAVMELQRAIDLLGDLVLRYPTDAKWREDLAIVFRRRGDLAFDGEIWDVAMEDYESSLKMRDSLIRLSPGDARLHVQAAGVVLAKAEVIEKTGDTDGALAALDEAERRLGIVPATAKDQIFNAVFTGVREARAAWTEKKR